jgi:UDP-glucose 6-dehydrogenase
LTANAFLAQRISSINSIRYSQNFSKKHLLRSVALPRRCSNSATEYYRCIYYRAHSRA